MTIKKQLFLPVVLLLLTQPQTARAGNIYGDYFHSDTLEVIAFFAASVGIAKLVVPEFGKQSRLEGKHNPDHDTLLLQRPIFPGWHNKIKCRRAAGLLY